jgi:hypothetical protein
MKLQKLFLSDHAFIAIASGTGQATLVIKTVLVGDAVNSAHSTGCSAVNYLQKKKPTS